MAAASLLHRAAHAAWNRADSEGVESDLHSAGLGIYLAYNAALALLPDRHVIHFSIPADSIDDPSTLVRDAERLLRDLAISTPGISQLVVEICDLARECPPA